MAFLFFKTKEKQGFFDKIYGFLMSGLYFPQKRSIVHFPMKLNQIRISSKIFIKNRKNTFAFPKNRKKLKVYESAKKNIWRCIYSIFFSVSGHRFLRYPSFSGSKGFTSQVILLEYVVLWFSGWGNTKKRN